MIFLLGLGYYFMLIMEKQKNRILLAFGQHIKKIRTGLKLSQDEVVMNSDRLIKATISDIENGKRNLSFTTLVDLAKGLRKSPKDLLDFKLPIDEDI